MACITKYFMRGAEMTKLRIESGHHLEPPRPIEGDRVRFITDDNRVMFEVHAIDDGAIEVRAVESCKVGKEIRLAALLIEPKVSNVIEIRTQKWVNYGGKPTHTSTGDGQ